VFSSRRVGLIQASEHQSGNLLEPLRKSYSLLCGPCGQELSSCCWWPDWQRLGTPCLRMKTTWKKKSCGESETDPWWLIQSTWVPLHHFHIYSSSFHFSSVQFGSVTQSYPTLCKPMNCSTPGLPVHHQLQEFTQTHVHRVSDAIQPSHPLLSPFPPAPNPSQHQGLFQ